MWHPRGAVGSVHGARLAPCAFAIAAKPGVCPDEAKEAANCTESCQDDGNCNGNLKCCLTACGMACQMPNGNTPPHTGAVPPSPGWFSQGPRAARAGGRQVGTERVPLAPGSSTCPCHPVPGPRVGHSTALSLDAPCTRHTLHPGTEPGVRLLYRHFARPLCWHQRAPRGAGCHEPGWRVARPSTHSWGGTVSSEPSDGCISIKEARAAPHPHPSLHAGPCPAVPLRALGWAGHGRASRRVWAQRPRSERSAHAAEGCCQPAAHRRSTRTRLLAPW